MGTDHVSRQFEHEVKGKNKRDLESGQLLELARELEECECRGIEI